MKRLDQEPQPIGEGLFEVWRGDAEGSNCLAHLHMQDIPNFLLVVISY